MKFAIIDIETRSCVNLEVAGVSRYARDPMTEVLCLSYVLDDDADPQIWHVGDPLPAPLFTATKLVAHNMAFERGVWTHVLTPRHGFPPMPPLSAQRCTMAMALSAALPAELAKLAEALDLPIKKDREGYLLMSEDVAAAEAAQGRGPERNLLGRQSRAAQAARNLLHE